MTRFDRSVTGRVLIRGVAADDGDIKTVRVNGQAARSIGPNFSQWEVVLDGLAPGPLTLAAAAEDAAGNLERSPAPRFDNGALIGTKS